MKLIAIVYFLVCVITNLGVEAKEDSCYINEVYLVDINKLQYTTDLNKRFNKNNFQNALWNVQPGPFNVEDVDESRVYIINDAVKSHTYTVLVRLVGQSSFDDTSSLHDDDDDEGVGRRRIKYTIKEDRYTYYAGSAPYTLAGDSSSLLLKYKFDDCEVKTLEIVSYYKNEPCSTFKVNIKFNYDNKCPDNDKDNNQYGTSTQSTANHIPTTTTTDIPPSKALLQYSASAGSGSSSTGSSLKFNIGDGVTSYGNWKSIGNFGGSYFDHSPFFNSSKIELPNSYSNSLSSDERNSMIRMYQDEKYADIDPGFISFTLIIPSSSAAAAASSSDLTSSITFNTTGVLRLHFIETYFEKPGKRIFDVHVVGSAMVVDYDIIEASGGQSNKGTFLDFLIEDNPYIESGEITIVIISKVNRAKLNGLEYFPSKIHESKNLTADVIPTATTDTTSTMAADIDPFGEGDVLYLLMNKNSDECIDGIYIDTQDICVQASKFFNGEFQAEFSNDLYPTGCFRYLDTPNFYFNKVDRGLAEEDSRKVCMYIVQPDNGELVIATTSSTLRGTGSTGSSNISKPTLNPTYVTTTSSSSSLVYTTTLTTIKPTSTAAGIDQNDSDKNNGETNPGARTNENNPGTPPATTSSNSKIVLVSCTITVAVVIVGLMGYLLFGYSAEDDDTT